MSHMWLSSDIIVLGEKYLKTAAQSDAFAVLPRAGKYWEPGAGSGSVCAEFINSLYHRCVCADLPPFTIGLCPQ